MDEGTTMTEDSSLIASMNATGSRLPGRHDVVGPLGDATRSVGLTGLANHLEQVRAWMQSDLMALESELDDLVQRSTADGDLARQAAAHLLTRPGKRIRPICVMIGAHVADVEVNAAVRDLAVACELVHAATLLHDDVIDEGTERRGAQAARMVYGNTASVLAGDYLLIQALERVAKAGSNELLCSLLDTISEMVAAEALQLAQRGCFEPSRETYLQVIEGKTASLFRWALCAAPRMRHGTEGAPGVDLAALSTAGTALGMAFQLVDDVLDLEGNPDTTGKDLFADLGQGKLTWPLIVASELDGSLAADVRALVDDAAAGELDTTRAAGVVERIRAAGAITRGFTKEIGESAAPPGSDWDLQFTIGL